MRNNLLLLLVILFSVKILAQPLNESFDNSSFPPTGWTSVRVSGSATPGTWQRLANGTNPTATPHTGAGMAYYNAYSWSSGNTSDLSTPSLNFTNGTFTVSFWMYRDNGFDTRTDKVEVYINTNNLSTGGTLLGTINRSIALSPVVNSNGWYQYSFSIPTNFNSATNYIIFKGISGFGNRIYIDDVAVYSNNAPNDPIGIFASSNSVCQGDSVTLYADGIVGQAYWFQDVCGGTQIGVGDSIVVYPNQTTSYFVRNYNNASFSINCAQIEITTNPVFDIIINAGICLGGTYQLPDGSSTSTDGSYNYNLVSEYGCDSIVTINLSTQSTIITNLSETICEGSSYFFKGSDLTQDGSYADTLASSGGCDSIINLELSVINAVVTSVSESICDDDSLFFGGNYLSISGDYSDTLIADSGCDSIVFLTLVVNSLPQVSIIESNGMLEADDQNLSAYQWYEGGNLIQGAESFNFIPVQSGDYAVQVSDSNGCKALSASYSFVLTSLPKFNNSILSIYPNPSNNLININSSKTISRIKFFTSNGIMVKSFVDSDASKISIIDFPSGIYAVLVLFDDGDYYIQTLVKE